MEEDNNEVDRGLPGVFAPDTLLPSQYFDRVRRRVGRSGEWQLLVAILEDAVHVYQRHAGARDPQNRKLFEDAEAWIEEEDQSRFLSFESVCDLLGLDPDYLRRGLRTWKRRVQKRATPPAAETFTPVEERRKASGE